MWVPVIILAFAAAVRFPEYPGLFLALGFCVSLITPSHVRLRSANIAKLLLAWTIVALGSTMAFGTIVTLSGEYFFLTASGITLTMLCAWWFSRVMRLDGVLTALIGAGTAICGASAIAAVGSALKAPAEKLSMALAVVLILNAVALIVFPTLGEFLDLGPKEFAAWAGLAIHDTSSVIGAAISFDPSTAGYAATVKLARAFWIAPLVIIIVHVLAAGAAAGSLRLPWFIWGYLLAALFGGVIQLSTDTKEIISACARSGFSAGIFLTGAAVDLRSLRALGAKPLILGFVLWAASAVWSLCGVLVMRG